MKVVLNVYFYLPWWHRAGFIQEILFKWGVSVANVCPLCEVEDETLEHLFSKAHTQLIYGKSYYTGGIYTWRHRDGHKNWNVSMLMGRRPVPDVTGRGCLFYLAERNQRMFQNKRRTVEEVCRIVQVVRCCGCCNNKIASFLLQHNVYP